MAIASRLVSRPPYADAGPVTTKPRVGRERRRLGPLPVAILLGMLALTAAIAAGVWHYQAGREQNTRQEWAQRASRGLHDQVSQTGAALVGVRALFAASNRVEKPEFARFSALELGRSGLLGLTWAPRVPAAARERFERDSGLLILDRGPRGGLHSAGDRAEYFPLRYLAPDTAANRAVAGLDVGVEGSTQATFRAARDSGGLTMSPAVRLGASATAPRGTVLVAAVYRTGAPLRTLADRRAALRGFTTGAWRYDQLAAPILALLPPGAKLVFSDTGVPVFGSGAAAGASATESIAVGGRPWTTSVSLLQGSTRWVQLAVILGGGLILTVLVALLLAQAERRRREREAGHAELRHEADTDGLTGLGNRRKLRTDFAPAAAEATPEAPLGFIMFDLDGFKGYNDSFGHPAGDVLLARLGRRLATAVPSGEAYRLGGDEFCVLVPVGPEGLDPVFTATLAALTEEGEGFTISSAHGAVVLPGDASGTEEAMVLADQRMYQQKARGRASAGRQSSDVLMRVLLERSPELKGHLQGVGAFAEDVGRGLGLDQVALDQLVRAAGLHDVGKVAIPESILTKPGPLDDAEMTFIRGHTLVGERILLGAPSLAPEAALVRASHERWDGAGYPDGLAGEQIPLGARIIFACDAFEAMTSGERPYRRPVSAELALEELRRCAGSQFDAHVVEVLGQVVTRRATLPSDSRPHHGPPVRER
jgi:diguanylate cyclase (GGDEF)-like protein